MIPCQHTCIHLCTTCGVVRYNYSFNVAPLGHVAIIHPHAPAFTKYGTQVTHARHAATLTPSCPL